MSEEKQDIETPGIFISHKHADQEIADVLRKFIDDRSGGRVAVFQSSSQVGDGLRLGRNLNQELLRQLWRSSLVLLVYTSPDASWDWCMWECGVATREDSPDTRVIVFKCGQRVPRVFEDQVRVDAQKLADIQRFTNELMTSKEFMPGLTEPLTRFGNNSPQVQDAAQDLYEGLQRVLPPPDAEPPEVHEWWPYPFLRFELSAQDAESVRHAASGDREEVMTGIVSKATVSGIDSEARRIFGVAAWRPGLRLDTLLDSWRARYPQADPTWVRAIATQVLSALLNQFPTLHWYLMRGVDERDGTWYAPVVNRVREIGDRTEFDVYFDKFELDDDEKHVRVNLPMA